MNPAAYREPVRIAARHPPRDPVREDGDAHHARDDQPSRIERVDEKPHHIPGSAKMIMLTALPIAINA
jgi:hypothetical protein